MNRSITLAALLPVIVAAAACRSPDDAKPYAQLITEAAMVDPGPLGPRILPVLPGSPDPQATDATVQGFDKPTLPDRSPGDDHAPDAAGSFTAPSTSEDPAPPGNPNDDPRECPDCVRLATLMNHWDDGDPRNNTPPQVPLGPGLLGPAILPDDPEPPTPGPASAAVDQFPDTDQPGATLLCDD